MRLGKSCRMVLVNCGNWDGTGNCRMGQGTSGENSGMYLELWDVPGNLRLVSYEMGPGSCGWCWRSVEH